MLLNEFPYWRRNLICVLFSEILVLAGFAAALPFVSLFFRDAFGIADENIRGIYVSLFSFFGVLGYASFCPVWGTLADKYGVKIMLLRGTFAASFIFPLMGYSMSPLMLIALRFVSAAMAGTTSASQMLLVKTVPEDKQGFALGVLSTAYWSGTMLGYTAGGFAVYMYGYKFAFTACGIMYFLAGIFVIFMKDSVKTNIPAPALSADCKKIQPEKARLSRSSFCSKRKLPLLYRLPLPKFSNPVWALLLTILFMCLARNFDSPYNAMMVEKIAG